MTNRPPRRTGLAHLVAATGYSLAGLRRLWREAAFRHEVLGSAMVLAVLMVAGVPAWVLAGQVILLLILIAAEALNTAIEELVDHLTADWAQFAKNAKDLGSLAVMCLLVANGVWLLAGLWIVLGG
jgi:diacylglycerol kinase (ATP)